MIAHIRGEITEKNVSSVIIDVSGVGYEIWVPEIDLEKCLVNETIKLHTFFVVREQSQDLYGFLEQDTKKLFELLLGVSGVGPKSALSITSLGEPRTIKSAIAQGNVAYLTGASGIGKRAAEKILVELKDRVGVMGDESFLDSHVSGDDAHDALMALGYSSAQASQALQKVKGSTTEERVRAALKELS